MPFTLPVSVNISAYLTFRFPKLPCRFFLNALWTHIFQSTLPATDPLTWLNCLCNISKVCDSKFASILCICTQWNGLILTCDSHACFMASQKHSGALTERRPHSIVVYCRGPEDLVPTLTAPEPLCSTSTRTHTHTHTHTGTKQQEAYTQPAFLSSALARCYSVPAFSPHNTKVCVCLRVNYTHRCQVMTSHLLIPRCSYYLQLFLSIFVLCHSGWLPCSKAIARLSQISLT